MSRTKRGGLRWGLVVAGEWTTVTISHHFAHERAYALQRLGSLARRPRVLDPEDHVHQDRHRAGHHGRRRDHDGAELPVTEGEDQPRAEAERRDLPDGDGELLAVDRLHERHLLAEEERQRTWLKTLKSPF